MSPQTLTRPLGILSNISLTNDQIRMLCAIESYDLWFVAERLKKDGAVELHLIDQAIKEFKRYMALVALGYRELAMISQEVDEVWHNFILFTREYGYFCKRIFGEFIHHTPNTSRNSLSPESTGKFIALYSHFFGQPRSIWRIDKLKRLPTGAYWVAADCQGCTSGPSIMA